MKFYHPEYFPVLLAIFLVFSFYHWRLTSKFYTWVKLHWFYKKSKRQIIGNFFYLLGMGFLLLSLMDLRGKESKIKSNIPNQKTIILIDSSSSMLVEDVRPNRFQKALLLSRHFVKEAPGNQIAIMLFSDFQKSFVPFTNDVDLLDARISGLSTLNISKGGSNLSQAIAEAVQYFNDSSLDERKVVGNILVFTDAEETSDGFELKIPEGISVALVGVGTAKGGTIPMRDGRNVFYGNKQFNGKDVVSQLDEAFMKSLGKKIKNYHFWVASSFSLPTREILEFFNKEHRRKFSQGDVSIKPVLAEWILIPAIIILILGYLFKMQKSFTIALLLCCLLSSHNSFAQNNDQDEKRPKLEAAELDLMDKMSEGNALREEKLKLADLLMRKKYYDQALILYQENLGSLKNIEEVPLHINYGTTMLYSELKLEGITLYYSIQEFLKQREYKNKGQWLETMRINTLLAFSEQGNKGEGKDKENNQKDKSNSQDQSNDQNSQNNQEQKNQDGKGDDKGQPNKNQQKPQDKNNPDKDKKQDKESKGDQGKSEQDKNEKEKDKSDQNADQENEENEKEKEQQRKMKVKLPAQLKQLMNDDRALQEKLLDTSTNEQFKGRDNKDW
ncbi:MAG: VWA domain-containing protein [Bacteriovoracaceae bacterium]